MTDAESEVVAAQCFVLWTRLMSFARIAKRLKIDERTVAKYVRAEAARRRAEMGVHRAAMIEQNSAVYERVREMGLSHFGSGDVDKEAKAARVVIDATKSLDRLHGLDAPLEARGAPALTPLAESIRALPPETILALVRALANRPSAPARPTEKHVDRLDVDTHLKESRT